MFAICLGNVIEITIIIYQNVRQSKAKQRLQWPLSHGFSKLKAKQSQVELNRHFCIYGLILSFDIPPYSTFGSQDLYTTSMMSPLSRSEQRRRAKCVVVASRLERLSVLNKEVLQFHLPLNILVHILGKYEDSMI